jgi:hypothetical protein
MSYVDPLNCLTLSGQKVIPGMKDRSLWTHFLFHCFLDADRLTRFYRPADSTSLGVQTEFKDSPQLLLGQNIYGKNILIGNQSHEWLTVAVSISWFSVDCREHASFRSQEEDGEFSEIAKPAAASQILRFAIGQVAYVISRDRGFAKVSIASQALQASHRPIVPFCV